MGQQWPSASGGSITPTIYPDGTMGERKTPLRRMRVGQLQAATLSAAGFHSWVRVVLPLIIDHHGSRKVSGRADPD